MWHQDDRFWRTYAPIMFSASRWANAPAEVEQMLTLLELAAPVTVLDLCCGPGRHPLELARRGYAVVGVDRTAPYITEARQRARRQKLPAEFVKSDMRRFVRPGAFDAAINAFTAFGYFRKRDDDRRVVENLHRSLKPGGRLLMEMQGKEVLARNFRPRDWHEQDGMLMLEERQIGGAWEWIESRWTLIKGTRRAEFAVWLRLYSARELSDLLLVCGFTGVKVYGDLGGAPYDQNARRLVVVATS